jgi:3-dehydroquinate dehydratase-2
MFGVEKRNKLLIIHGPNLNILGERSPEQYGSNSLKKINSVISDKARSLNFNIRIYQSNHEGKLIDIIHKHRKWANGIVINPGALTHYSYALRDALEGINLPVVEVHLSDIQNREDFRKISVIHPVCIKQIIGLGINSYLAGIEKLYEHLDNEV